LNTFNHAYLIQVQSTKLHILSFWEETCAGYTSFFDAKMLFYNVIIKLEICTIVYNSSLNDSSMMVERAFVLINTNDLMDDDILLDQLKKIDGISEAYKVCGIYDILVKVEAETTDKVLKVITIRLKNLKNIRSTLTMVAIRNS
jgi:DNA-binding Lrp family transcriptional regulator